jgi:hypothetical protein
VVFEGKAEQVTVDAELEPIAAAFAAKYGTGMWDYVVRDGAFIRRDVGESRAIVFRVQPVRGLGFRKGDIFSRLGAFSVECRASRGDPADLVNAESQISRKSRAAACGEGSPDHDLGVPRACGQQDHTDLRPLCAVRARDQDGQPSALGMTSPVRFAPAWRAHHGDTLAASLRSPSGVTPRDGDTPNLRHNNNHRLSQQVDHERDPVNRSRPRSSRMSQRAARPARPLSRAPRPPAHLDWIPTGHCFLLAERRRIPETRLR